MSGVLELSSLSLTAPGKDGSCNLPGSGLLGLDIVELPVSQERYEGRENGPFGGFLFTRLRPVLILKPSSLVALQV